MIYLLDDETEATAAIQKALRFSGIANTRATHSWHECRRAMEKEPPILLLLDLLMPDFDGEELLPEIFSLWPTLPVFIITGEHDLQRAVRCIKKGASEYLTKPVAIKPLQTMIEAYMPQKEAEKLSPEKMVEALFLWSKTLFDSPPQTEIELFEALRRWVTRDGWKDFATSLRSVAESSESNTTYLSQFINAHWSCSFPTWLNRIRLVAFLRNYSENKRHSIEGILHECGFKSRSSFYSTLQKEIGTTPGELKTMDLSALIQK